MFIRSVYQEYEGQHADTVEEVPTRQEETQAFNSPREEEWK